MVKHCREPIFLIDERLRKLSEAWGLPLSALMGAMRNDEDDDGRRGGEMGGRQPANAGLHVDGPIGRFVE